MIEYDAIIFVMKERHSLKDINLSKIHQDVICNNRHSAYDVLEKCYASHVGVGPYRLRTEASYYGYNVRVVEYFMDYTYEELETIVNSLVSEKTKLIGISSTWWEDHRTGRSRTYINNLRKIVQPLGDIKFVIGGGNVVGNRPYEKIKLYELFDFIVATYAEEAFIHILDLLSGKIRKSDFKGEISGNGYYLSDRKFKFDVNNVRTVWLPEDDIKSYSGLPIEISRGCIFNCSFCTYTLKGKKKFDYFRREDELVEEFKYNYEQFGVTRYQFVDDTYNDSREKVDMIDRVLSRLDFDIEFGAYIKPELLAAFPEHQKQLVDQGLRMANYGFESFSKESRAAYRKGNDAEKLLEAIKNMWRYSLSVNKEVENIFLMIIGGPGDTIENTHKTFKFLKDAEYVHSVIIQPLAFHIPSGGDGVQPNEITSNAEKYGYTLKEFEGEVSYRWEGKHMNKKIAVELADRYSREINSKDRITDMGIFLYMPFLLGKNCLEFYKNKKSYEDFVFMFNQNWLEDAKGKEYNNIINNVRTPINVKRYIEPQEIKFL